MTMQSTTAAQRLCAQGVGVTYPGLHDSGPVIALQLGGFEDAVSRLRELVGKTNPRDAAPGTIRAMYGTSLQENAIHASDGQASAEREVGLVFPGS